MESIFRLMVKKVLECGGANHALKHKTIELRE